MPNTVNLTAYECAVCHKVYANRDDAMKCELSHRCACEIQDYYRLGYAEHYGEVFISGIYFNEKKIKLEINDDGTIHDRDSTPIKYCPFCGRELKGNDKSEEGDL